MEDASKSKAQLLQELASLRPWVSQLESAMTSLHDSIYVVDPEGRIVFCNTALARLTGYSLEALRGRLSTTLYIDDVAPMFLDRRKWALAGDPVPPRLETELVRQDCIPPNLKARVWDSMWRKKFSRRMAAISR